MLRYNVRRSTLIQKEAHEIRDFLANFKNWPEWSP